MSFGPNMTGAMQARDGLLGMNQNPFQGVQQLNQLYGIPTAGMMSPQQMGVGNVSQSLYGLPQRFNEGEQNG